MSWRYPEHYQVIIVGGGHAGCEAALAAARMGCSTLLLTMSLDTIAKMSCNPAVGGVAKGHMVREIDALGGEMGKVTDATGIQFRMLNHTKGPAVWAPRAQTDKVRYQFEMKRRLENTPRLQIKQGTVESLITDDRGVIGVATKEGISYYGETVVISSGTFMRGLIHIGETHYSGGRAGDQAATGLSASLLSLGVQLGRLKTGTPPRVHARSIDFSLTEEQPGDEGVYFSYDAPDAVRLPQISCHITYTTLETKQIIQDNLHRSPMYSGQIESIGPRYCPSIEDKVVRFADKERHQIFLEPEGLDTHEVYVNGVSSSLPFDVQLAFIRSVPALRHAQIMRPAYAIEYDYALSGQIDNTLACKGVPGLYFAGQINGTTGYEEAAAQGMMAGINAALCSLSREPFILKRSEAYIGVMVDDLVTKGLTEPYRMFTSRAEHRLLLRQDNADLRLREYGYQLGIVEETRYVALQKKKEEIEKGSLILHKRFVNRGDHGYSLAQMLCRPEYSYEALLQEYPDKMEDFGREVNLQIEIALKYRGYIERQQGEIDRFSHIEKIKIPLNFDFMQITGIGAEAKQKLKQVQPASVGQAARISGVSPADITVLLVALKKS